MSRCLGAARYHRPRNHCPQRACLGLPADLARRLLAHRPSTASVRTAARLLAQRHRRHPCPGRSRHAPPDAADPAGPGLPGPFQRDPGRRREHRRHRRGRRRPRQRQPPEGHQRQPDTPRLGWQGLGDAAGPGRGRRHRLRPVHRRRHQLCAGHPHPAGRSRRRPVRAGLPDGAAPLPEPGRAPADPGVRLLLRPALPVPPGQPPHEQESGRSRRVHAGPARRPRRGRRPQGHQRRPDRRRCARHHAQAGRPRVLARLHHRGDQPTPLRLRPDLEHGGQERLHPAQVFPGAASRNGRRPRLALPAPSRRHGHRPLPAPVRASHTCRRGRRRRVAADVGHLPAHAQALPAEPAAGARPSR